MQRALNKHHFRSIIYFIMAIGNVVISIPLAIRYGIIGVTIGTMISVLLGNGLIMNLFYHKVLKINMIFFWKEIAKTWKGFPLPIILGIFIMKFVSFDKISVFLITGIIYTMIYCISIFFFSCNKEERNLIFKLLGKRRKC